MTREDIIRMARKVWSAGEVYVGPSEKTLEEFDTLVAASAKAEEREECAKLLESRISGVNELMDATREMEAYAIRARGETK